jgi:hypothetical protein
MDSRAAGFFAEHGDGALSYELDAWPPNDLRQLVGDCIRNHAPDDEQQKRLKEENRDRERIASRIAGDDFDYAWAP